jgi:excisionase family DNA binding protein
MAERCDCHTCVAMRQAVSEALDDVVERIQEQASSAHRGMYRRAEAAAYLGIGVTKLDELVGAGEVEVVPVDRLRLFPKSALDATIERWRARRRGLAAVR